MIILLPPIDSTKVPILLLESLDDETWTERMYCIGQDFWFGE